MADEDAGGSRSGPQDDDPGLGFWLPPLSLPEMRLPERIRLAFPFPDPPEKTSPSKHVRARFSHVLLAVLLADAVDAAVVLWAGPETLPWVRAAVGTALSVVLAGFPGLLYGWELAATLGGFGWLAVAPTLTVLVLVRALFSE